MARRREVIVETLILEEGQTLFAVPDVVDGRRVTKLYVEDRGADPEISDDDVRAALATFGAWSDLDFDEMMDALDRMRHESPPSPLLDL